MAPQIDNGQPHLTAVITVEAALEINIVIRLLGTLEAPLMEMAVMLNH